MTQLYVGNLSADGDEKAIRALFGKYGAVREVLMKNGYAFVEYESSFAAEEAIRSLNGECRSRDSHPTIFLCIHVSYILTTLMIADVKQRCRTDGWQLRI